MGEKFLRRTITGDCMIKVRGLGCGVTKGRHPCSLPQSSLQACLSRTKVKLKNFPGYSSHHFQVDHRLHECLN